MYFNICCDSLEETFIANSLDNKYFKSPKENDYRRKCFFNSLLFLQSKKFRNPGRKMSRKRIAPSWTTTEWSSMKNHALRNTHFHTWTIGPNHLRQPCKSNIYRIEMKSRWSWPDSGKLSTGSKDHPRLKSGIQVRLIIDEGRQYLVEFASSMIKRLSEVLHS